MNCYALSGESLKPAEDWKRPVNVARALPAAAAATAFTPLFQLRSDATAMRCGGMLEDGDTQLCVQGIAMTSFECVLSLVNLVSTQ